jgi:hypothetical protein
VDREEQGVNNTNKNMEMLIQKYGHPTIDYLGGGTWRLWFQEVHQHHGIGSHGSLAAQGATIEEAIMRLHESTKKYPAREGMHCCKGCPEFTDDWY